MRNTTNNTATVSTLRATRIAVVQAAAMQALRAQQSAKRTTARAAVMHAKQQAFMLEVQQAAAKYGITPQQNTIAVRAVRTVQQHAPSAIAGACKQVHAIAAANNYVRSATLAACKLAGINPATAATQYAQAAKAHKAALQAAQ